MNARETAMQFLSGPYKRAEPWRWCWQLLFCKSRCTLTCVNFKIASRFGRNHYYTKKNVQQWISLYSVSIKFIYIFFFTGIGSRMLSKAIRLHIAQFFIGENLQIGFIRVMSVSLPRKVRKTLRLNFGTHFVKSYSSIFLLFCFRFFQFNLYLFVNYL